jgi:polar amino acid transport system substrate-binding protein
VTAHDEPLHLWHDEGSVVGRIQRRGLLKVGVGVFEPWVMCDTNGNLIGYEVDVARRMAEDLDVRIQFVRTAW